MQPYFFLKPHKGTVIGAILGIVMIVDSTQAGPLGADFTFQGQLVLEGQTVDGPTDFDFTLWDAELGGNIVGLPLSHDSVLVNGGVFTVDLDFGAQNLNGDQRWLEVSVRHPAGSGSFTILDPRQALLATPYAVTALEAKSVAGIDGHSLDAADGSPANALFVNNAGNVGIGTTAPLAPLDLRNDWATLRLQAETVGASTFIDIRRSDLSVRGIIGVDGPGFSGPKDQLSIATWSNHPIGFFTNTLQRMTIDNGGNVGIGTTTPGKRLHVGSNTVPNSEGMIRLQSRSGTGPAARTWDIGVPETDQDVSGTGYSFVVDDPDTGAGAELMVRFDTGHVGVGTETPLAGLHVNREPPFPGGTLALEGDTHTYLGFFPQGAAAGRKGWLGYGSANTDDLTLTNVAPGNINIITPGNVGIGTVFPQDALDVAGIIRSEGVRLIGGADIAEPFNVNSSVEVKPGMVVAIDPTAQGELMLSDQAYDARVAGIISGANGINPGMTLSQTGSVADGEFLVALTGRVWCCADAEANGSITPGDMLTTSATVGHAMKAADRQRAVGATIGKAMTSLESGKGMVLVLVNLQ